MRFPLALTGAPLCRRCYTTQAISTAIYHSRSNNPWFNLAFEEWIFRNTPPQQLILYIYRNQPCVVIGRNQNPWKEINLRLLRQLNIPFVRRRSGGGTVYHDMGNSNYCVFVPRTQFERKTHALMVSDALNSRNINTYVNDRNDICIDGFKISHHVSGSAFKLIQARAYHHGTMLISAKLQDLRGVLSTKRPGMTSKGVESVPSPVRNLREWDDSLSHQDFFEAVADEFVHTYGGSRTVHEIDETELDQNAFLRKSFDELQTWDWQWGQTPEFKLSLQADFSWALVDIDITCHHGITSSSHITARDTLASPELKGVLQNCSSALVGQRYENLQPILDLCDTAESDVSRNIYVDVARYLEKHL